MIPLIFGEWAIHTIGDQSRLDRLTGDGRQSEANGCRPLAIVSVGCAQPSVLSHSRGTPQLKVWKQDRQHPQHHRLPILFHPTAQEKFLPPTQAARNVSRETRVLARRSRQILPGWTL
jgi:hypothetical protein